jgi:hypothetical protein
MSRSDVIRRLRALSSRGVPISVRYLLPVHADLVGQALAIFGSFDRARAIAGLPAPPLDHDVDVVIGALRSLARSGVRLDAGTLSSMGESGLVSACIDLFGSVAGGAARAGLAPPPEPRRAPSQPQAAPQGGYPASGFAQPPLSADGNVPTALALEILQKTALQLNRVPVARDLPPDVARRLTSDYGSVRFAYLALRIHAEGQAGQKTAEGAAQAAAEPLAMVSQEALAATARMPDAVGVHRRNVEASHAAAAAAPVAPMPAPVVDLDDAEVEAIWAEVERAIDEAAAIAGQRLREQLAGALEHFVGEVTEIARHSTLAALVPQDDDADEDDDEEEENAGPAASDETS